MHWRIAIKRVGKAFVKINLQKPAVWGAAPGLMEIPATPGHLGDPGNKFGLFLDGWRLGAQETGIRWLSFSGGELEVHGNYGDTNPWELWLSVDAPTLDIWFFVTTVQQVGGGTLTVRSRADNQSVDLRYSPSPPCHLGLGPGPWAVE